MNSKPYKIIVVSLSLSLIAVLLLQGFWIRNLYIQKQDEFNKIIYQTLLDISNKLNERENINYIKLSTFPKTQTRITKKGPDVKVIVSASSSSKSTDPGSRSDLSILKEFKMDTVFSNNQQIIISDSVVHVSNNYQTVTINKQIQKQVPKKEDIDKLLNKMLTEIKTIDVSPIEDLKEDSLKSIIKKSLATKGVFIPFEFLLKKEDKSTDKILAKSEGYSEKNKVYKSDLSNNKIFSNHNYLYLQFPNESDFVFAQMKNMLILAALFSLIIMAVFYVTLKTILNQKKISEIKNDFINNMTHELKTPIATISLAIDAINNSQVKHDEEKFQKYTTILKEENNKLNNHVERVLQMSLLDKGELHLHKKQTDIIELIHASINTHKLQIAKQHTQIVFEPPQTKINAFADEFHMLAVFNNLLDNALKYSNQNCRIEIRIHKTSDNIIVSIKDNGIGIAPELHKKVFDKFYRVQGGNLHDVKGFGLGLSYVKSIVEQHGGSIELQSERGCEFTIKLPVNEN